MLVAATAVVAWPRVAPAQTAEAIDLLASWSAPCWEAARLEAVRGRVLRSRQHRGRQKNGGGAVFGIYKDLMPSIVGIGASAEGYVGGYSGVAGVNGGGRALLELRGLYLKAGVDYDVQREDASFILSLTVPLRRGGILGYGTNVRVDWLPGRGNSWNFGLQVPLEPHMGKTRPRVTDAPMPRARKPARAPRRPEPRCGDGRGEQGRTRERRLGTAFWSRRQVRSPEVPRDVRAEMLDSRARSARRTRCAAGRAHGDEVEHPPRPARPRFRARGGRLSGAGEVHGRAARRDRRARSCSTR